MKQKRHRYRNRLLSIRGKAQFGMRVEKPKKGKGSYTRKKASAKDNF